MIAYSTTDLDNRLIQRDAYTAFKKQCVTEEEKKAVTAAYPVGLYTPNPFIRIGLFIATVVIAFSVFGIFVIGVNGAGVLSAVVFFFSVAYYVGLEIFVQVKRHFASGVDDALMWMSGAFFIGGFLAATEFELDDLWLYALLFLLGTYFTLRFVNVLMCATAFIGLTGMVFYICFRLGSTAQALIPFFIMALSLLLYRLAVKLLREERFRHYFTCLEMLAILSLVTLYLGGNYYIVREVGMEIFGMQMKLGWLFWLFTLVLPVVYIYLGIRHKNAILLRVGLLVVAAMVFTIRFYYHVLPLELAMTLGGTVMIALAWYVTHYLKEPRHGFTREEDDEPEIEALQIESLVIAETLHETPHPPQGFKFGGGSGGGGGAGGDF